MLRPHEVAKVSFTARAQEMKDGISHFVYEGSITVAHNTQSNKGLTHGTAKLTGVGRYDAKQVQMCSLGCVFDGVYNGPPPYDQPRPYSAVVVWA